MRHKQPWFVAMLRRRERGGLSLTAALRQAMCDESEDWQNRGIAGILLAQADARGVRTTLLDLFFAQTEKFALWSTALAIEKTKDHGAIPRLILALSDDNPDRRHAAARALGWILPQRTRASKALLHALIDKSQPQPVREEVAESLAYSNYQPAIPHLIEVLDELDVRMRFWAVFALGSLGRWGGLPENWRVDRRVVEALERMLGDKEEPTGNWWPVGREALSALANLDPHYQSVYEQECQRVRDDPNSPPEELRWAGKWVSSTEAQT